MNKGGRPAVWKSPEFLQKLIDNYFEHEKNPTMSGLAYYLGVSRSTLYNYAQKDRFLDTVRHARRTIEAIYEKLLIYGPNSRGAIFALKHLGWSNKVKVKTNLQVQYGVPIK